MPLHRRLPKRGFKNIFRTEYAVINVKDLARFNEGEIVDRDALVRLGVLKKKRIPVKLLGKGDIDRALHIKVHAVSKTAREKVEAAGGKIEVI